MLIKHPGTEIQLPASLNKDGNSQPDSVQTNMRLIDEGKQKHAD